MSERERARIAVLESELRALQSSERASRARETALVCALDEHRRRTEVEHRALRDAAANATEREIASVRKLTLTTATTTEKNDFNQTHEDIALLRERVRAAEKKAEEATRALANATTADASATEKHTQSAIKIATEALEVTMKEELESMARALRAGERASAVARRRAAELAREATERSRACEEWRARAEAAMDASEHSAQELVRVRDVMLEMQRRRAQSVEREDEKMKIAKRLGETREELEATRREADAREVEHEKVRQALQKAQEKIEVTNSLLAEAKAEFEHAKETLSVELAEKERLTREAGYLRNELENMQTSTQDEVDAFNRWRAQSESTEKELKRSLHEAQRDAARHALTARKLQQKLSFGNAPSIEEYRRRIAELEEEFDTIRAEAQDAARERDALRIRVEDLTHRASARASAAPAAKKTAPARIQSARNPKRSVVNLARQTLMENDVDAMGDEDDEELEEEEDEEEYGEYGAFDVAAESLFQETVDEFFEDADAEDARLDADHAHAYALAKRLHTLESRAANLLWRERDAEDVARRRDESHPTRTRA